MISSVPAGKGEMEDSTINASVGGVGVAEFSELLSCRTGLRAGDDFLSLQTSLTFINTSG